jgi:hypothetical protein
MGTSTDAVGVVATVVVNIGSGGGTVYTGNGSGLVTPVKYSNGVVNNLDNPGIFLL